MALNNDQENVRSFGRCAAGVSQVYYPTTVDDVVAVFDVAANARPQKRIVLRGAGHSFDGQAVHDGDNGGQIVLDSRDFKLNRRPIRPHASALTGGPAVTLDSSVAWGDFVKGSIKKAKTTGAIRIPGSMQTGRMASVGGTLAGNTLSRFSGLSGKESAWIESFGIVTPYTRTRIEVTAQSDHDLFYSVIGGLGYIGFVTDATYRLIDVDPSNCARTNVTLLDNFHDLIQKQLNLIRAGGAPRAISSAWFVEPGEEAGSIKGGVFDSVYAKPSKPKRPGFALYDKIDGPVREWIEINLARNPAGNLAVHEYLYASVVFAKGRFEDTDLMDFWFFMDGNTVAKLKFETDNPGKQFPIEQQTFVIPAAQTEAFALNAMQKIKASKLHPTEFDMLFVKADQALMSANYNLDGFAVSLAFEPNQLSGKPCPPKKIPALLRDLSKDCAGAGGRIHMTKNVYADPTVFRGMFNDQGQIQTFENVKRRHDPQGLIRNPFSDRFFKF